MTQGLRRTVGFLSILAGLGTLAGFALSQHPNAAPPPAQLDKRIYTNKTKFHLPVKIEDRVRMNLREVCLFVKHGQADWVRHESGGPQQKDFTYNPTQDGEYWFSIVMIDKTGKATPSDVNLVPPALKVVVDTKPPVVELQPWTAPDGENCLRCTVQDANPDFGSLKLTFRGSDHVDRALVPKANLTGVYKMPPADVTIVRVSVGDRCTNATSREIPLPTATAAAPLLKQPVPPVLSSASKNDVPMPPPLPLIEPPQTTKAPDVPAPVVTEAPKPQVTPPVQQQVVPVDFATPPTPPAPPVAQPEPKPALQQITPPEPKPALQQIAPPEIKPSAPPMQQITQPEIKPSAPPMQQFAQPEVKPFAPPALLPRMATAEAGNANRLVLNTNQCALEYRIDHVGPSGVGKVEVFITTDQGNTWRRLCEDTDRRSPVEMDLPGEGLFGVRLVITNGNGFGGTPPARGEMPTMWVEVDATNPMVQLRDMEPTLGKDGSMEIRWMASDRNLRPDCVSLYFATNRTGPWQNIARSLPNDGMYRWSFPREINAPVFLRVEVTDQAGNTARADSAQPVALDTTEPRGTVLGITPISIRPSSVMQGHKSFDPARTFKPTCNRPWVFLF